jgi:hypothetical protein
MRMLDVVLPNGKNQEHPEGCNASLSFLYMGQLRFLLTYCHADSDQLHVATETWSDVRCKVIRKVIDPAIDHR